MWRPAGFNKNQQSAFDYANLGRINAGGITSMADDGESLLTQTGYQQQANLGSKGLMGLTRGLMQLDDARVNAKRQQDASQAGLASTFGNAVGGLATAGFDKLGSLGGGGISNSGFGTQWNSGAELGAFGIGGAALYQNPFG